MDVTSLISGFSQFIADLKTFWLNVQSFIGAISSLFSYLPAGFWAVVVGALVVVIVLRILGR